MTIHKVPTSPEQVGENITQVTSNTLKVVSATSKGIWKVLEAITQAWIACIPHESKKD